MTNNELRCAIPCTDKNADNIADAMRKLSHILADIEDKTSRLKSSLFATIRPDEPCHDAPDCFKTHVSMAIDQAAVINNDLDDILRGLVGG